MTDNISNNSNLDAAKQLIEAVKQQFELENEKLMNYKREIYREKDFRVRKIYAYNGPNYYLDRQAMVFNIFIAPSGDSVNFFKDKIIPIFPKIQDFEAPYVIDLFAETLMQVLKMDIDLFISKYAVSTDGDEYVVSVEYLDKIITEDAIFLVSDWFRAISQDKEFDFQKEFIKLQAEFDKTLFGGPTLYSLIEAGVKLGIPVTYMFEENQFQWGYGKKQLRGRSTTFHNDGIKDTEFTMFKDMVGDFLELCGFPTPTGKNCYEEEEILAESIKLGYPVVIKPVAGHKGQGVTTGIESEEEVRKAFQKIVTSAAEAGVNFDGALVQKQVYGTDHRLIAVGGKFIAALERVPAYVDGDGTNTIAKLIEVENEKIIRLDNARSPLCKIKADENLIDFIKLQNLSLTSIPKTGERITLRRVANISAGGVSINVTDNIHPLNIKLVEDIARFFDVRCLGIDVLAKDISKPWMDGDFGIIEINAGPGVFMHLAPAYGGSIDVPHYIMKSHFKKEGSGRIPIIAGNQISLEFSNKLNQKLHEIKPDIFYCSLTEEGIYFNSEYFHKHTDHNQNVKLILRNPSAEFALFTHTKDDIFDFGILHRGADIVIINEAAFAEEVVLKSQLLPGALCILVEGTEITLSQDEIEKGKRSFSSEQECDDIIFSIIEPILKDLIYKYE